MTTTPLQRNDKETTDHLYDALLHLPEIIGGIESEQAAMVNCKREAQANLDDAELNAKFNVQFPEKCTVDAQKRLIEFAIEKDEAVKKFRKEVMRYDAEIEMNEVEAKSKRREFQAAIALTELHSARINAMYRAAKTN